MFALDATLVDQCPLCGPQLQHQECACGVRKGPSLSRPSGKILGDTATAPMAALSPSSKLPYGLPLRMLRWRRGLQGAHSPGCCITF